MARDEEEPLEQMRPEKAKMTFPRITGTIIQHKLGIKQLLTFDGCPEMLRGSPISTVMRRGAAILGSSAGTAETYQMSEQVDRVHTFISHNWVVPRAYKFLCLSYVFNFHLATVLTMLIFSLPFYFLVLRSSSTGNAMKIMSPIFVPVFLLIFFCVRDVQDYLGFKSEHVFLDKTCIHQTDPDIKAAGIKKLGAFLAHSDRLVVIWTPHYLQKLWTVYELASFMSVHPKPIEKMQIVSVERVRVFLGGMVLQYIVDMVLALVWFTTPLSSIIGLNGLRMIVFTLFLGIQFMKTVRAWARQEADQIVGVHIKNFDVQNATCFRESDRPLVLKNIVCFYREKLGDIGGAQTAGKRAFEAFRRKTLEKRALDAFNEEVRRSMPRALSARSVGGYSSFSYWQGVWLGIVTLVPCGMHGGDFHHDPDRLGSELILLWHLLFVLMPGSLLMMEVFAKMWRDLRGLPEWCWLQFSMFVGVSLPLYLTSAGLHAITKELAGETEGFREIEGSKSTSDHKLLWNCYIASVPIGTLTVLLLFHHRSVRKYCRRRRETVDEHVNDDVELQDMSATAQS